jgi:serine/threonine protein kinase
MIEEGARVKALHGHFGGTVDNICWLAPEVLAQDLSGYSFQSDMYSVGIAALELATGEAPFAGLPVTEIMMLKLRGHPPILMKKLDGGKETQLSNQLSKVVDLCVDPNPSRRPSPAKLLNTSLFRARKKSLISSSLKDLLLPVVPLDTSMLMPVSDGATGLESALESMNTEDMWTY